MAIRIEITPETDGVLRDEMSRGLFGSLDALIQAGVAALRERERFDGVGEEKPFWKAFATRMHALPDEAFAELPSDGAREHDHYIHGTPRSSS